MLPPLTDLLDVREFCDGRFAAGAAWIPFSQLRSRLSELPPSSQAVRLVDCGSPSRMAYEFLLAGGRPVELVSADAWVGEATPYRMWSPNEFLEAFVVGVTPGTALDLGCGAGREAVFLASLGWQVRAVDRLVDSSTRGPEFAARYGVEGRVTWECAEACAYPLSGADLVCSFFALDRGCLSHWNEELPLGATLLVETFTETHRERFGKPSLDRVISEALVSRELPDLTVLGYGEEWRKSGRHTGRLVAGR